MGNKPAENIKTGLGDQSQLIKEYTPAFNQLKANPAFFSTLLPIQTTSSPKIRFSPRICSNSFPTRSISLRPSSN
jgi:hypothetical protein